MRQLQQWRPQAQAGTQLTPISGPTAATKQPSLSLEDMLSRAAKLTAALQELSQSQVRLLSPELLCLGRLLTPVLQEPSKAHVTRFEAVLLEPQCQCPLLQTALGQLDTTGLTGQQSTGWLRVIASLTRCSLLLLAMHQKHTDLARAAKVSIPRQPWRLAGRRHHSLLRRRTRRPGGTTCTWPRGSCIPTCRTSSRSCIEQQPQCRRCGRHQAPGCCLRQLTRTGMMQLLVTAGFDDALAHACPADGSVRRVLAGCLLPVRQHPHRWQRLQTGALCEPGWTCPQHWASDILDTGLLSLMMFPSAPVCLWPTLQLLMLCLPADNCTVLKPIQQVLRQSAAAAGLL